MITLSNANNALKTYYLGVLSNQLNVGINPFLAKIEHTSTDVYGKEIKKLAPYGLNGGVSSGAETDSLPVVGGNQYAEFVMDLKNLYGQIEISDKAIRASQNSVGAFVNLLNAEMEGLLHASKYNFGRMLFGDGSGMLSRVSEDTDDVCITVDNIKNFIEGMIVDFYEETGTYHSELKGARILAVDRIGKTITIDKNVTNTIGERCRIYVQGSKNKELTGLEAIFEGDEIYGLDKSEYSFLQPYVALENDGVTASAIQRAIDA
ncbi:MAG: phage major capsid protein, partial [Clostridia bacterium]|nr:phage major capsid protein [Clostridia bacterium]